MLDHDTLPLLREALDLLDQGFAGLPAYSPDVDLEALRPVLLDAAKRMQGNYPYPHPLYAGQMLTPPHPIARLAYALSIWINPNNHALDGGRASSRMEQEAVADIARMFGWTTHLGHLCGGGTMANMEALWVAREVTGGKGVVASAQAHYTHSRLSSVLGVPFQPIATDACTRMDLSALENALQAGDVGTVVATLGTTGTGACDPLPGILALRNRYGFRLHVDAAYGGYFTLADNLRPDTRAAFDRLTEVDSLVVDPHKHGLQPYGCGCVLFRDPSVGSVYKHDSPYTYFTSDELHLGEISLECSRAGASAVALWATHKLLPPVPGGEFARGLADCRRAALGLFERLGSDARFITAFAPDLDIVVWAPKADRASDVSALSQRMFDRAADQGLHLAKAAFPASLFGEAWPLIWDQGTVTCLRSCLMKPEHLQWLDRIWSILDAAAAP